MNRWSILQICDLSSLRMWHWRRGPCVSLWVLGHACHLAGVGPPTKFLTLGAGPIGFVTMLAAHAFGSHKVVIADISVEWLNVTTELGADTTDLKVRKDLLVRKEFTFILISNVRLLTLDWEGWLDANQFLYDCQCVLLLQHIFFVLELISGQINVKPSSLSDLASLNPRSRMHLRQVPRVAVYAIKFMFCLSACFHFVNAC